MSIQGDKPAIRESKGTRARARNLARGNELIYILKIVQFAKLLFHNNCWSVTIIENFFSKQSNTLWKKNLLLIF